MNESDVTICMDESRKGGSSFIVIYVHFHGRRTTAGIQRCGVKSAVASKARTETVARIVHDCSRESESIDGE